MGSARRTWNGMEAGDTAGPREQGLTLPWCQMLDGPGKERDTQGTVSVASTHVHEGGVWAWGRAGVESSPDHRKKDGIAADKIYQKEKPIVTDTLLIGLDDNVGQVSQDLWGRYRVGGYAHVCRRAHLGPQMHLYQDPDPKDLLVGQNALDKGPARADQGNGEEEGPLHLRGQGRGAVRGALSPLLLTAHHLPDREGHS